MVFIVFILLLLFWFLIYRLMKNYEVPSQMVFQTLSIIQWIFSLLLSQAILNSKLENQIVFRTFRFIQSEIQVYYVILILSYILFELVAQQILKQLHSIQLINLCLMSLTLVIPLIHQNSWVEAICIVRYSKLSKIPFNLKNILLVYGMEQTLPYHIINMVYQLIYSFSSLVMLPYCLILFILNKYCANVIYMLILIIIMAIYTTIKINLPQIQQSIQYIRQRQILFIF
ncbi:transmembrane protein, putative (macronuclear) [Tetrahymena thermophila SB210]|uniref:Transmembrane protein, putative n=1 Tax=Tetrahymena thermophila (strain SB210) TaxID=312017 RepID=W7X580_TETTS|nr:transmembrane protein, putative [Tetrahymena thermophila SB210]EWS72562.1 transmembrane protein, putative [Tetrahymena thermophila SB210]|eukprot:XP_012654845.1 transmembrane protein, putative [Tetrahymena thermophila SB210]